MRIFILAMSLLAILLGPSAAHAERRVAFVVGNGNYKNVTPLPNPAIDAKSFAATLRNVGFEVVEGVDLTRDKMTEKLLDFGQRSQGADIAVFYYAGHGIAVDGVNYLLPVDADIKSEAEVKLGAAINVDVTLEHTLADAKVKLVFLDACRDNPFAAKLRASSRSVIKRGLAEMKSGEGTLIAFATGPGQTALDGQEGSNSPFTRALIKNITQPGVEIQQALTKVRAQVSDETSKGQLPWGHTNLTGTVYLNPSDKNVDDGMAGTKSQPASSSATTASDVEMEFWRSVRDSWKAEELNAYLTAYPNGQFRPLALARLSDIEKGPSTTTRNLTAGVDPATFTDEASQLTEDQIGLDRGQRRDVQRRLNGLGFETRVNGKFDDNTRSVIRRWQAARGYPASGYLNKLQHKALLGEIVAMAGGGEAEEAPARRRSGGGGGGRRYHGGGGGPDPLAGPGAFFGGVVGGMFGRHR